MSQEPSPVRFCLIALSDNLKDLIRGVAPKGQFKEVNSESDFENILDDLNADNFEIVICGAELGMEFPIECGQITRQQCGGNPIYFVAEKTEGFDQKNLVKNGFSFAYILPMDKNLFTEDLNDALIKAGQAGRSFKPVFVIRF